MSHKTIERDGITYTPEMQEEQDKRDAKAARDDKKLDKQEAASPVNEEVSEEKPRGRK